MKYIDIHVYVEKLNQFKLMCKFKGSKPECLLYTFHNTNSSAGLSTLTLQKYSEYGTSCHKYHSIPFFHFYRDHHSTEIDMYSKQLLLSFSLWCCLSVFFSMLESIASLISQSKSINEPSFHLDDIALLLDYYRTLERS